MFATALAVLMAAQMGPTATMVEQESETRDVAYESVAAGDMQTAIANLEAARAENPGDPALLINLGAAYAATGDFARAEEAYRAAIASNDRYELELADGQWIDSRRAARLALLSLENRLD
ncbi:tetratricopeptide repeat protein [Aurantiacibacter sp. MUD11]|uniref:tetratricopeptide repeat protein n=1 Tax=Aurantiacibacter sp. MUD11 TaxID=3003265 RepID=UPI0022AB1D5D|nr:tetratricopeptide repeat protein [Aurantiacibacter sp. MUD11]WAT17550.1 tetratricopeptide repeat protein [Aurantiacibacter sp. MUD11]